MNLDSLRAYLIARAHEASTWRGLIGIATGLGAHLTPGYEIAIITTGVGLAGVVGAAFPDEKKPA